MESSRRFIPDHGDERCLLPPGLWGRGEDISGTAPAMGRTAPTWPPASWAKATLQARYLRGAFDGKRSRWAKTRAPAIRVAIAELAANAGPRWALLHFLHDPQARLEIVRYTLTCSSTKSSLVEPAARRGAPALPALRVHAGDLSGGRSFPSAGPAVAR